jgi:FKBP-type peptidyl-prolyl cis-trans isomerase FkpA
MFYRTMAAALIVLLAAPAVQAVEPETEEQKTLYVVGTMVSNSLSNFALTAEELEYVQEGITDAILGNEPKVDIGAQTAAVQALVKERSEAAAAKQKEAGAAYLAIAAAEPGAEKTESGLIYTEIKAGDGAQPAATDSVTVHYVGTLIDGTEFDSSISRGQPATFPLNRVVACWTEGVQKIKVGGKAKLVCPSSIGYGERGSPPKIKPGATLIFEVELLSIEEKE